MAKKKDEFLIVVGPLGNPQNVVLVAGTVFHTGEHSFGVARMADGKTWGVYEITTGLLVGKVPQKKGAMELANLSLEALDHIFSSIKKGDWIDRANEMIMREYERLGMDPPLV